MQLAHVVKNLTGRRIISSPACIFHNYAEKIRKKRTAVLNQEFLILQVIAITIVVIGHGKRDGINLFFDWFMPGSFHMPLFIFISGYFYKVSAEKSILTFLIKKCKTLLLPYFIWNFIYGVFATLLCTNNIITFSKTLSFRTLFIDPWLAGTQFGFNVGGWFVLSLFLVEIVYILLRRIRKQFHLKREWLFGLFLLCCGLSAVYFANSGYNHGLFLPLIKAAFLLPFFHFGYLYRERIEPREKLPNWIYFVTIFIVQMLLLKFYAPLSFGAYNATFSHDNVLIPYLSSLTGGLFWLRISKILARALKGNRIVRYIGQNTWAVMMHHPISFFIINCIIWGLSGPFHLTGFDLHAFQTNIWYAYSPGLSQFAIVYVVAGVALPLLAKYGVERLILHIDTKRTIRLNSKPLN